MKNSLNAFVHTDTSRKMLRIQFLQALIMIAILFFSVFHAVERTYAGQNRWTQEGGNYNLAEIFVGQKFFRVSEYVPANSTVKLFATNNGNRIHNADGSVPYYEYTNTSNDGFTDEFTFIAHKINGKTVTDIDQETKWNPVGELQAAAFNENIMLPFAEWLNSAGFSGTKLRVPDFNKETDTLFFGVPLNAWAEKEVSLSTTDVGSMYSVFNGTINERISGTGPSASQLVDFYISNTRCTPDGFGGWTSQSPYSGEMTLFGFHEFDVVDRTAFLYLSPDPIYAFYRFAIPPMSAKIYLGGVIEPGYAPSNIDSSTFLINGMTFDSWELLDSIEDYPAETWELSVSMHDFIDSYPLWWNVTEQTFTVSGMFNDSTPFNIEGEFTVISHRSGDANADGDVNIFDVTYLIVYLYNDGPAPARLDIVDVNADGFINIFDVTYLISYLYKNGPAPNHP